MKTWKLRPWLLVYLKYIYNFQIIGNKKDKGDTLLKKKSQMKDNWIFLIPKGLHIWPHWYTERLMIQYL